MQSKLECEENATYFFNVNCVFHYSKLLIKNVEKREVLEKRKLLFAFPF